MNKLAVAAFCAATLFISLPAAADTGDQLLQQAKAAEAKKDYKTSEKLYQQAAEAGSAQAQYHLGLGYNAAAAVGVLSDESNHKGSDPQTQSEIDQAVTWFTRAAEQGDAKAQAALAELYEDNTFGKEDDVKARQWRLAAAQNGDAESQYILGSEMEKGKGVPQDVGAALGWYQKAAAQDYTPAKDAVLRLTPPGDDPVKQALHDGLVANDKDDIEGAIKAYRRAAALGSVEGQWRLGDSIMENISLGLLTAGLNNTQYTPSSADCKEMLDNLQKAAAGDNSQAMYDLGMAYASKEPYCVTEDDAKAKEWFQKAAKLGNKDAQKRLAPNN